MFIDYGFSFGVSAIAIAVIYKLIILPLNFYTAKVDFKRKQVSPDLRDYEIRIKKFYNTQNYSLAEVEVEKLKLLKKKYKIRSTLLSKGCILYDFIGYSLWYCLYNKLINLPQYTGLISQGGLLWFKDLSVSDPYFILPLVLCVSQYYNFQGRTNKIIENNYTTDLYTGFYIVPIILFPVVCCFSSGINLYFVTLSLLNTMFIMQTRTRFFQRLIKYEEFIPDTRLHVMVRNRLN